MDSYRQKRIWLKAKDTFVQTIPLKEIQKQAALLQIAERFFDSVTLFALYETGVFKVLSFGSKSLQEIQERIRGNEETLRATLDAAVALKLLSLEEGRYNASEFMLDCLGREDSSALFWRMGDLSAFVYAVTRTAWRRYTDRKHARCAV